MVTRLIAALGREIKGLHEAAYLLAAFAVLSQLLALVRDKILAFMFGASSALVVYYGAFRIPDLLFVSIGSLVSASVLLPYFVERFSSGEDSGKRFLDSIFSIFFIAMTLSCAVVFVLMPQIANVLIPGLAQGQFANDFILSARIMLF